MTATLAPSPALTASDRCDRCGAQAYVRVMLATGGDLLFCAHHALKYEPRLRQLAAEIHDETGRLTDVPATAPVEER